VAASSRPITERRLLSPALARVVRAAHEAFFPDPPMPDPVPRLEHVFSDAKRAVRRMLVVALWGFELAPLAYRFSRFSRLSLQDRTAWLDRLRRSKGGAARAIYSVLKVLLQSLAYDDPAVERALVPDREGAA
jgi:hypothetical protein